MSPWTRRTHNSVFDKAQSVFAEALFAFFHFACFLHKTEYITFASLKDIISLLYCIFWYAFMFLYIFIIVFFHAIPYLHVSRYHTFQKIQLQICSWCKEIMSLLYFNTYNTYTRFNYFYHWKCRRLTVNGPFLRTSFKLPFSFETLHWSTQYTYIRWVLSIYMLPFFMRHLLLGRKRCFTLGHFISGTRHTPNPRSKFLSLKIMSLYSITTHKDLLSHVFIHSFQIVLILYTFILYIPI